jgi:hypothetical protein
MVDDAGTFHVRYPLNIAALFEYMCICMCIRLLFEKRIERIERIERKKDITSP